MIDDACELLFMLLGIHFDTSYSTVEPPPHPLHGHRIVEGLMGSRLPRLTTIAIYLHSSPKSVSNRNYAVAPGHRTLAI